MWAHDLKLGRAREHLKELEAEIDRWVHVDGYTIGVYPQPEPPSYVVLAEDIRPPAERIPLLIGDCLYNARAALEYLAYALNAAGAEREMSPEEAERSGFPIVGDVDKDGFSGRGSDMFDSTAGHMLPLVTNDVRAAIKELQPFNEGDPWEFTDLWCLHELARLDRHRRLHLGAIRSENLELDRRKSRNIKIQGEVNVFRGTLYPEIEDSAELATVTAFKANPQQNMEMHFTNGLAITFDTEGAVSSVDEREVDWIIRSIVREVGEVIRNLRPHLPAE